MYDKWMERHAGRSLQGVCVLRKHLDKPGFDAIAKKFKPAQGAGEINILWYGEKDVPNQGHMYDFLTKMNKKTFII